MLVFTNSAPQSVTNSWLLHTSTTQLSFKACPNTWLPKTLTIITPQPTLPELCPAKVTNSEVSWTGNE